MFLKKPYPLQLKYIVKFLQVISSSHFLCDLLEKIGCLTDFGYSELVNCPPVVPLEVLSCIAFKLVVGSRDSHQLKVCMFLGRD